MRRLRRTKIVATLGPASSDRSVIASLFEAGADVFRINMSHTSHERMRELVATIRSVTRKGCNYDREEVMENVARYLGFSRITEKVRDPIKSAVNGAIRRGVLEREGSVIWRQG